MNHGPEPTTLPGAALHHCHDCGALSLIPTGGEPRQRLACPRCGADVKRHPGGGVQATWALLLAAAALYVPANLLPMMTVTSMGQVQTDTIISGVVHLVEADQWPLALIVFVASVVVPLLKMLVLVLMLITVQRRWSWRTRDRARLLRTTEAIGRWSMIDIYVIAVLAGLVRFGNAAHVEVGPAALYFAAVVVLTMLAARALDEKQLWEASPAHGADNDGR